MKEYLEVNKLEFSRWIHDNEQGRVDLKVLPYLQDIDKGIFVEAGALDGLFMSNTKILEDLGWTGLCIEPSLLAAKKCFENRKCAVEQCALVSKDFKGEKVSGDFFFDGAGGLGAWSGIHKSLYGIRAAVIVPAKTLEEVLDIHAITHVDFLSLDVEGHELEVLKGIDLHKINITYILIEINLDEYSLEEMDEYLGKYGYTNVACLSGFSKDLEGWNGLHNDYLYRRG